MHSVRVSAQGRAESGAHAGWRWSRADGATTCYHRPAGEDASERQAGLPLEREIPVKKGKRGSPREQSRTRIDKLGVTGSSPVPPIESPCKSATSVFLARNRDRRGATTSRAVSPQSRSTAQIAGEAVLPVP